MMELGSVFNCTFICNDYYNNKIRNYTFIIKLYLSSSHQNHFQSRTLELPYCCYGKHNEAQFPFCLGFGC